MFTPTYRITNNLLKYIGRIEACKEVIANAPLVPAWEAKFQEEARMRTIHHGTHLEGNDLTKEQAALVIKVQGTSSEKVAAQAGIIARERDIQEVINYRNVLDWIDDWGELSNRDIQYSDHMLKELHTLTTQKILPADQVGHYRQVQVVVRSVENGEIAFRPPQFAQVPILIQDIISWLNLSANRDIHAVLRAGIAHYELVRIHPFIEGNGRTSRAFAILILYSEGYEIQKLFSLEEYFDHDIDGYYRALRSVQQSSSEDMTYWLEYFCFGLAVELDRIKQRILKLSQDAKLKSSLGGVQIALTERQIAIMELLQEKRGATTAEINKILPMISPDTVLRDLKDMMNKGILKKEGVTKGVIYFLKEQ